MLAATQAGFASAARPALTGPDRYTYTLQEKIIYEWWMMTWAENELVCKITAEYEGLPLYTEVYIECGEGLADAWLKQENCPSEIYNKNPTECPGYYMYLASSETVAVEVPIPLPPPMVWITLPECTAENGTNRCERPPVLLLQGEEPLPEEEIIAVNGNVGETSFACQNDYCELYLNETDEDGIEILFWAVSSYGDTSETLSAKVRVLPETNEQGEIFWYVDVLSSQWRGDANPSCAQSWEAFPPKGGLPYWLSTPASIDQLESDIQYAYLAGNLIKRGVVDTSQCIDFGIDAEGQATTCGLEAVQDAMLDWQNRFDQPIMDAALETQIPAVLMKRLFARESQFWPGVFNEGTDIGLGQLTIEGADFAFTWNPIFFEQFCPLILEESTCEQGYLNLSEEDQGYMRRALVYSVNATCDTCPLGVDLTQADFSVNIFANTLRASCEQTGSVIYNNTDLSPGEIATYEDLWRFTLVNYNAGAGCLGLAVDATYSQDQALTWGNLSQNLTEVCIASKDYVEDISTDVE